MPKYYKMCSLFFPQNSPRACEKEKRNYGHIWPKLIIKRNKTRGTKLLKKKKNHAHLIAELLQPQIGLGCIWYHWNDCQTKQAYTPCVEPLPTSQLLFHEFSLLSHLKVSSILGLGSNSLWIWVCNSYQDKMCFGWQSQLLILFQTSVSGRN